MESIKAAIAHITATPFRFTPEEPDGAPCRYPSPERGVILCDTISGEACEVTFGHRVWCDNLDDLYIDMFEDILRTVFGARTSLAEYTAHFFGVDLLACADDDAIFDALVNELGYGAAGWINDIANDRLTYHPRRGG